MIYMDVDVVNIGNLPGYAQNISLDEVLLAESAMLCARCGKLAAVIHEVIDCRLLCVRKSPSRLIKVMSTLLPSIEVLRRLPFISGPDKETGKLNQFPIRFHPHHISLTKVNYQARYEQCGKLIR